MMRDMANQSRSYYYVAVLTLAIFLEAID